MNCISRCYIMLRKCTDNQISTYHKKHCHRIEAREWVTVIGRRVTYHSHCKWYNVLKVSLTDYSTWTLILFSQVLLLHSSIKYECSFTYWGLKAMANSLLLQKTYSSASFLNETFRRWYHFPGRFCLLGNSSDPMTKFLSGSEKEK